MSVRARRGARVVLGLAALLARAAAGGERVAPVEERERKNPVASSPGALAKGRALYQRHCASCHGDKGKGDGPASRFSHEPPRDLTQPDVQKRVADGEIFWKISTGLKEGSEILMPGFTREISAAEDRWKVVLFVRSLGASP